MTYNASQNSPLLDIWHSSHTDNSLHADFETGYLDSMLAIFQRYGHPFVIVGETALCWSSSQSGGGLEVHILMKSQNLSDILHDIINSGDWKLHNHTEADSHAVNNAIKNENSEIWLRYKFDLLYSSYLCIHLEGEYQLLVDECPKIEVPDVHCLREVTLESEYYRDEYRRFGPVLLSQEEHRGKTILPRIEYRAKWAQRDIPIFIPTIEAHLNALLDQARLRKQLGQQDLDREGRIYRLIEGHYWEWPPARDWLLGNKVRARNYELMKEFLERFKRKPSVTFDFATGSIRPLDKPWEEFTKGLKKRPLPCNDTDQPGCFAWCAKYHLQESGTDATESGNSFK